MILFYVNYVYTFVFKNFHNSTYFSSAFSISFHYSTWLSSMFSIYFHNSTCLSSVFSISFHYSTCIHENKVIKGEALLTIGYANFSHVTIVFIAKYLFTGSVQILNKLVFKINKMYFNKKS